MIELIGEDLFDQIGQADAICITTNCTVMTDGGNPMGGGCAGAASRRWPNMPYWYGRMLRKVGHVPVIMGMEFAESPGELFASDWIYDQDENHTFIVMYPTMHKISEPASLALVARSATLLSEMADTNGWTRVVVPRPGAGLGGLDWESQVKPLLEEILDDRFVLIHKEFGRPTALRFYQEMQDDDHDDQDES